MKWTCEKHEITDSIVNNVKGIIGITFPEDFLRIMRKYDGGYPEPNKITVDGVVEIVNNLVSFCEDDESYILDIIEETEYFSKTNLIPIAEDPFGNLFCYDFKGGKNMIVFWNHETNENKYVCDNFKDFINMLHK